MEGRIGIDEVLFGRGMRVAPKPFLQRTTQVTDPEYHMAALQQPLDEVIRRVQGEYIEMPGLRLTTAQAQRL